jgi:hypothetical protein
MMVVVTAPRTKWPKCHCACACQGYFVGPDPRPSRGIPPPHPQRQITPANRVDPDLRPIPQCDSVVGIVSSYFRDCIEMAFKCHHSKNAYNIRHTGSVFTSSFIVDILCHVNTDILLENLIKLANKALDYLIDSRQSNGYIGAGSCS